MRCITDRIGCCIITEWPTSSLRFTCAHACWEPIFTKPLATSLKCQQWILLSLQRYSLSVKYKRGKDLYLADTLSRAYLPDVNPSLPGNWRRSTIDHGSTTQECSSWCSGATNPSRDHKVWPNSKVDVPECTHLYFDIQDELKVQEELIFKGQQLVVPRALRMELMAKTHSSHIGVKGCIRRARDTFFWTCITVELKEYISKCEVCHRSSQQEKPILQHVFVAWPWESWTLQVWQQDTVSCQWLLQQLYQSRPAKHSNIMSPNQRAERNICKVRNSGHTDYWQWAAVCIRRV